MKKRSKAWYKLPSFYFISKLQIKT